jgi:hypothetical protein
MFSMSYFISASILLVLNVILFFDIENILRLNKLQMKCVQLGGYCAYKHESKLILRLVLHVLTIANIGELLIDILMFQTRGSLVDMIALTPSMVLMYVIISIRNTFLNWRKA